MKVDLLQNRKVSRSFDQEEKNLPGVLAGGINSMLVKPLSTSSQGHGIWDGDLTINWGLAGYHCEAFGKQSRSNKLSVSDPGFWTVLVW